MIYLTDEERADVLDKLDRIAEELNQLSRVYFELARTLVADTDSSAYSREAVR